MHLPKLCLAVCNKYLHMYPLLRTNTNLHIYVKKDFEANPVQDGHYIQVSLAKTKMFLQMFLQIVS